MNNENSDQKENKDENVQSLTLSDLYEDYAVSPIDLWLHKMTSICYPNLQWGHMNNVCRKMKLYNTGFTRKV